MNKKEKKIKLFFKLLFITYIFNIFDTIATYYFVTTKNAIELNPFMRLLLEINPIYFIVFKVVFVGFAIYLLYKLSKNSMKIAFKASIMTASLYSILFIYEMLFIILFITNRI